jgi:vacuolar protein-sorting-associated protein 4
MLNGAMQFKEYLARAEYLKGVTGQDSSGPENGAAAAQKVRKPGAGGKEDVSGL